MAVSIQNWQKRRLGCGPLRRAARTILRVEGVADADVAIVLADDATVQALNREYRNIDRPTDVLSFSQRDTSPQAPPVPAGPAANETLGDVVLSVDAVVRQAEQFGVPAEHEAALLVVHGILHLLGLDDTTDEGADEMRRREKAALDSAGIRHHRM